MSTVQIDRPAKPEWMEGVRYDVPSRTDPHVKYACELTHFNGNGQCACDDFQKRFYSLLSRMVTPEEALEQKFVTQREYQRTDQVLMCWHLVEAHWKFEQEVLARIIEDERAKRPPGHVE